jgi:hypothetical protein
VNENYEEEYIRSVKETLRQDYETLLGMIKDTASHDHRHLTARDKKDVDGAIHHIVTAYHLALDSNSLKFMRAVDSAFAGAAFAVMRCSNPLNVKKFWDLKSHGSGGQTSGVSRKANMEEWRSGLMEELQRALRRSTWPKHGLAKRISPSRSARSVLRNFSVKNRSAGNMPTR